MQELKEELSFTNKETMTQKNLEHLPSVKK